MAPIKSPYFIRNPQRPAKTQGELIKDLSKVELVKLVANLTQFKKTLQEDMDRRHAKAMDVENRMLQIDKVLNHILEIKKGEAGHDATVDVEYIINELLYRLPPAPRGEPGLDAKPVDEQKIINSILSKIPPPQKVNTAQLVLEVLSKIPPPQAGKSADPLDVINLLLTLPKGKGLKIDHIEGLKDLHASMWSQIGKGGDNFKMRGGGDTLKANTGYTLQRNSDGTTSLVLSGGGSTGGGVLTTETPSGLINSSNVTFTVLHAPLYLTVNGQILIQDVDYSLAGLTITAFVAPPTSSIFRSWYNASSTSSGALTSEIPTGTINSSNATFTVIHTPTYLTVNGQVFLEGIDYSLSGLTVTMFVAPPTSSILRSWYTATSSTSTWIFDFTPAGTVNGVNTLFTIPSATQVVVIADGVRVKGGGIDYSFSGASTITFVAGRQPFSSISVDYLTT